MELKKIIDAEWVSVESSPVINKVKSLDVLEKELADIKNNILEIEEKQRFLANLSRLYS